MGRLEFTTYPRNVHPFFRVLAESLSRARLPNEAPTETILFRIIALEDEQCSVELSPRGCRVSETAATAEPDLTIYCDRTQLDSMLAKGLSESALRFAGKRELFGRLAELAQPPVSWLDAQRGRP